jgi:hypothetical protein
MEKQEKKRTAKQASDKAAEARRPGRLSRLFSPLIYLYKKLSALLPEVTESEMGGRSRWSQNRTFVLPTAYPPGRIRNLSSLGRAVDKTGYAFLDDLGLAPTYFAWKRYRARSIWYKLGWLLLILFVALLLLGMSSVVFRIKYNREILLHDIERISKDHQDVLCMIY